MIEIENHQIPGVEYLETPNQSGLFKSGLPDTVVIHYTAGGPYKSSVNWLVNPQAKASAHLVVGRQGEIIQLLPFNQIAWHAGESKWNGRTGLNAFSIGIEMANFGLLQKRTAGYFSCTGKKIDDESVVLATHKNQSVEQPWEAYTAQQIETVEQLCLALIKEYGIREIVGHDDIAPLRKTDPGPAFPMDRFKNKILYGRDDAPANSSGKNAKKHGVVLASKLNVRTSPGVSSPFAADPLKQGTPFEILDEVADWVKVKVETEGWVSKQYVKFL